VLSWIEMQRRCRQGDADCVTDRQTTLVVNQILPRSDADRVAVKAPWIRDLSDRPAQHQAAVGRLIGRAEPCLLAAEVSHRRGAGGNLADAFGNRPRLFDSNARIERAFGDDDLPPGTCHRQRHDVGGAHEASDERRAWPGIDLVRGADLRHMPGIEDSDAVGHHHCFLPVMRDVYRGDAKLLLQRLDLVSYFLTDACVEVGERLVEQQDLRIDCQRATERHSLALAAGKGRHPALAQSLEAQHRQQIGNPRRDFGPAHPPQLQPVGHVLSDRHVRPQRVGLEYHRNVAFVGRQAGDVAAADRYRPAGQCDKAADRP